MLKQTDYTEKKTTKTEKKSKKKKSKVYLSSILHLLSRTLQCVLKFSNSFMHFLSCWHTDSAWLQVGKASTGYGSFSVLNREEKTFYIVQNIEKSIKL